LKKVENDENKGKNRNIFAILPDILMIIGFISVAYGLWQIYQPAMFIICGALVILLGYPRKAVK